MDAHPNQQSKLSPWAQAIDRATQKDGREQPWKAALEAEKQAKEDGTYDAIADVSKEYPDAGREDDGIFRACNF